TIETKGEKEMKRVHIKQLSPNATLPTRTHSTNAGLDIDASEELLVTHLHAALIPTGSAMNIPGGYEGEIRPRSGKSTKTNLRVVLGTIDAGYTAEIGVIADALDRANYLVQRGDKIAQLVIQRVETPQLEIVDQFDTQSERGEKGF